MAVSMRPGLADPVRDSQRIFRAVLDAMSRPGRIAEIAAAPVPPAPLDPAAAAVLLALADYETPLWLDEAAGGAEAASWLAFHTGAPRAAGSDGAVFALVAGTPPAPDAFALGSDEFPETAATVIVQVRSIAPGDRLALSGPGIESTQGVTIDGIAPAFWEARAAQARLFPRGIDLVFTAGRRLCAIPRTTRVTVTATEG